jgi:hypothetical protein
VRGRIVSETGEHWGREAALNQARYLAYRVQCAGLIVTSMYPHFCHGGWSCLQAQVWSPSGEELMSGDHETTETVLELVQRHSREPAIQPAGGGESPGDSWKLAVPYGIYSRWVRLSSPTKHGRDVWNAIVEAFNAGKEEGATHGRS